MCFHPDTLIKTKQGNKKISELNPGDIILTFNEANEIFEWKPISGVYETPSIKKKKVKIHLDNGESFSCTSDHKWLTSNRGWIEAENLTIEDDLVTPKFQIYKITNKQNDNFYIGYTSKSVQKRLKEHFNTSRGGGKTYLNKAIRKFGESNFNVETLDFAYTLEEAHTKEKDYIDTLKPTYNLTLGGEGCSGLKWTNSMRRKASEKAYIRTEDHREHQRLVLLENKEAINKSRKTESYKKLARERWSGDRNPMCNPLLKEKARLAKKGKQIGNKNSFYGKHHSPESIAKMKATKQRNKEMGRGQK
jgi:group I intron endonuclease